LSRLAVLEAADARRSMQDRPRCHCGAHLQQWKFFPEKNCGTVPAGNAGSV